MSASTDLTTLASAKQWLSVTGDDAIIGALITAASDAVLDFLGRPFLGVQTYTEYYSPKQDDQITLRQWPVQSVASVVIDGAVVTAQATGMPPAGGYLIEDVLSATGRPQKLKLFDYNFRIGDYGALVNYVAGYQVSGESRTVPSAGAALAPNQTALAAVSVTYANGTALVQVAASPVAGQFVFSNNVFIFSSADAGASVLLTYSTVPPPVQQAVNEIVGEAYARRQRIGVTHRQHPTQGSVSTPFIDITPTAKMMLSPYRRVALA